MPSVTLTWHVCKYNITRYINSTKGTSSLDVLEDVPLVEFMSFVFTHMPGEKRVYPWWSLCTLYLHACQVRVTKGDSGLCCCTCVKCISSANKLPSVLILHKHSGPCSVSDFCQCLIKFAKSWSTITKTGTGDKTASKHM